MSDERTPMRETDHQFDPLLVDRIVAFGVGQFEDTTSFRYARTYFEACATCITPEAETVEDPDGLLKRFEEVFLALRSRVRNLDVDLTSRIDTLEGQLGLAQNVVSLGVMAGQGYRRRSMIDRIGIKLHIPLVSIEERSSRLELLNGNKLHEIKTALIRLAGLMSSAIRAAEEFEATNRETLIVDGYYDPRRVSAHRVREMLATALLEIDKADLPEAVRNAVQRNLNLALQDLSSPRVSWSTVISRVTQTIMVLGAVVAISADADKAASNLREAHKILTEVVQYVATESVSHPSRLPLGFEPSRKALPGVQSEPNEDGPASGR